VQRYKGAEVQRYRGTKVQSTGILKYIGFAFSVSGFVSSLVFRVSRFEFRDSRCV